MEAVPKLPMLSFELKVSPESTHFGPKLKQYISEAYREDPDSYNNEMHQLEGLRSAAIRPTLDVAGLNALTRYFCQLRAIQSRFPMAKGQPAAVPFAWKDIFANMSCSFSDIRFEMACILYNIGALITILAALESRSTPDSLKSACTYYQKAGWAFQYLKEQYPQPSGVDVSQEIMRFFQEICFAQAQECILEKSIQDTRKPSVIGAVATQVLLFYRNSLALLGPSTGQDNIHEIIGTKQYNHWHRYLSFKASYIGCVVCLYQGMNSELKQNMGERVAFYQQAVEKLADARKLVKYIEPNEVAQEALTFTNDVVEGKRKAAKNENEFIYHEEVPDKDLLMDMKPVCLIKALPINFNDPEISGPDIFARLVPMGAHEASSMYSEEKAKLLRHVVNLAEEKNTELTEFMSSLQLDQLDILNSDQKIPQEIVDRCAAMNAKTDIIQTLVDSMNNLAEIISDVEHSLADIKAMIQEEAANEKEFQKVMGPRPPSIVQTELSREYNKYQEAHSRTNESNQVLHKAMTLHITNLRLLSQPLDQLQSKIPSIDNIEGLDRDTMNEMRRVVGKAREMQVQRDSLIQELRDAVTADDITTQLLARSSEPLNEIFKQEMEKHTPKVKIIEQNLAAQENIINRLTSVYASYGESRRLLADVIRKREGLINALITSYDSYEELLGKSQKGLDFYRRLTHNVSQLLNRLRSTCQVQEEERAQQLSKQSGKSTNTTTVVPTSAKSTNIDHTPAPASETSTPKLRDYLPYMKSRGLGRSIPMVHSDTLPSDSYYPEHMYPPSVRPAPVGSEATTDPAQMKYPDGYVVPSSQSPNPYNAYGQYSATENNPYSVPTNYYPAQNKSYEQQQIIKPPLETDSVNYGYNTAYTPSQYSNTQNMNPQYNPYYTGGTQDNASIITESQNSQYSTGNISHANPQSQYNYSDPYASQMGSGVANQYAPIPEAVSAMSQYSNQTELSGNFAQMQISTPKHEPKYDSPVHNAANFTPDYTQNFYMQYPQASTPSMTYSTVNPNVQPTQVSSDYSSINYPHSNLDTTPISQAYMPQATVTPNVSNTYSPDIATPYSYNNASIYEGMNQVYPTYTNANNSAASLPSTINPMLAQTYSSYSHVTPEPDQIISTVTLSELDGTDTPIKSHVTGEALSTNINACQVYPPYDPNITSISITSTEQNYPYADQVSNPNYTQTYQSHPGYSFNMSSGNYDYSYGSQNSYGSYAGINQSVVDQQMVSKEQNWSPQGVYTSAGSYDTLQSPSENQQVPQTNVQVPNSQGYYNTQYGYQANVNQTVPEINTNVQPEATNYAITPNQSTYIQTGQGQDSTVTYSDQVSTNENIAEPLNINASGTPTFQNSTTNVNQNEQTPQAQNTYLQSIPDSKNQTIAEQEEEEIAPEKPEPSAFDLLSDIDFSVEQKPLMPEIKVPQVSESAIKKVITSKLQPVKPVPKVEDIVERPAKMDLFSDPSLLNKFTQEVKTLQKLVDSLTNKAAGGLTVLDSKWKGFQDMQMKENMIRTKTIAMQHSDGNIVTDVVPFDDSRLILKWNPDAYINASYYKQLAPWCIPLVISKSPPEKDQGVFWRAVLENKISCIVCLLSEIEIQGTSYFPTAIGQTLEFDGVRVTLEDVTCTVHWSERKITVCEGKSVLKLVHYQITVFPAKIVCPPLVMLADKILNITYENKLSNQLNCAWIHCAQGAGRSAIVSLLLVVMCQVRAGQLDLCDMLDTACMNLYKHRANVLEDTKYLADAYRTTLFYVQGVLFSGTTLFNGETVSGQSGASVLPPVNSPATSKDPRNLNKFSRESFEEMKQSPGLKSGDMKDPLNFLDPLWSLKKK